MAHIFSSVDMVGRTYQGNNVHEKLKVNIKNKLQNLCIIAINFIAIRKLLDKHKWPQQGEGAVYR